jgi:hypothetical protein
VFIGIPKLSGAVQFGLDPTVVKVRRSRLTYGVGVLNRFNPATHPESKLVVDKGGAEWCTDVFDKFVLTDQPLAVGDVVVRSYTPAQIGQKVSFIRMFVSKLF